MYDKINTKMLLRFLSGKSNETENEVVQNRMKSNVRLRKLIEVLQFIWGINRKPIPTQNVETAWMKFQDRVMTESAAKKSSVYRPVLHPRPTRLAATLRVAVISLILVVGGYYLIQEYVPLNTQGELQCTTIRVDKGERRRVNLPDGTRIMMDAGSEITFAESFLSERVLTLQGEAYFEVAPDVNKPFSVKANHALVQVLGTKFNVRAWDEANRVEVAVTEGKVAVKNRDIDSSAGVLLGQGDFSLVKKDDDPTQPKQVNVEAHLGWMHNVIDFRDVKIQEVFAQLERWYNFEISIEDTSFLTQRMTIHVNPSNVDEVLELISLLTKTDIKREGKHIQFIEKKSNTIRKVG